MTSAWVYAVLHRNFAIQNVHGSVAAVAAAAPLAFQKELGRIRNAAKFVTTRMGTSKIAVENAIANVKGVLAILLKNDCAILPN